MIKNMNYPILGSNLLNALEAYQLSFSEHGTIEAVANSLWILFVRYLLIEDDNYKEIGQAVLNGKGKEKDFVKKYILSSSKPNNPATLKLKSEYILKPIEILKVLTSKDGTKKYLLKVCFLINSVVLYISFLKL